MEADESYKTRKPTRVMEAATVTIQGCFRQRLAVLTYVRRRRAEDERIRKERLKSEAEEESVDEEWNALVDENESLHTERVQMTMR